MLKLAVAGFRHPHIFELLQEAVAAPDCSVVACCEEDPATRETLRGNPLCAAIPLYDDYRTMLREADCDAVGLGDYYAKRGGMAIAALEADKHVIADKPLCTDLAELAGIRTLAYERNRKVGLMLPLRSSGNTAAARNLIREGKIGEVQAVSFTGQHPLNYGTRPGWYFEEGKQGGTINDIAVHGIDTVCFLTGMKFRSIAGARTWNGQFPEVPDFRNGGQFLAVLDNLAGVTGDVSYFGLNQPVPSYWRFTVWGTRGWLEFNTHVPGVQLAVADTPVIQTVFPAPGLPDYRQEFLADIDGRPGDFATDYILEISEWALRLQAAADASGR